MPERRREEAGRRLAVVRDDGGRARGEGRALRDAAREGARVGFRALDRGFFTDSLDREEIERVVDGRACPSCPLPFRPGSERPGLLLRRLRCEEQALPAAATFRGRYRRRHSIRNHGGERCGVLLG
jgi:hypothetical protein